MKHYKVRWEIDVWEDDELAAAKAARRFQQNDPENIANVFDVFPDDETARRVDLATRTIKEIE